MKRVTKYILLFIISAIMLLVALSIDNMLWVTASPEWEEPIVVHYGENYWIGPVKYYSNLELLNYLVGYRIATVWTNLRDIMAATIVGFLVVLSVMIRDKLKERKAKVSSLAYS